MPHIDASPPRVVENELLDTLQYEDGIAARIHKDIDRYNRLLGNYAWMTRQLRRHLRPGDRVLEIAAGRGFMLRHLLANGALEKASGITAFDAICPCPPELADQITWHITTAETYHDYAEADVVIVCNFLHQLKNDALEALGRQWQHSRLILAAETHRSAIAHRLCRLSRLIGFSREGIGDGTKSLRAGFRAKELPDTLQLKPDIWTIQTDSHWLGSYRLRALKK